MNRLTGIITKIQTATRFGELTSDQGKAFIYFSERIWKKGDEISFLTTNFEIGVSNPPQLACSLQFVAPKTETDYNGRWRRGSSKNQGIIGKEDGHPGGKLHDPPIGFSFSVAGYIAFSIEDLSNGKELLYLVNLAGIAIGTNLSTATDNTDTVNYEIGPEIYIIGYGPIQTVIFMEDH